MPSPSLLQRLKERKLVQWAFAYLAGAFVVFQAVEVLAEPWGISPTAQRGVHIVSHRVLHHRRWCMARSRAQIPPSPQAVLTPL
jgi:hypothetical protein